MSLESRKRVIELIERIDELEAALRELWEMPAPEEPWKYIESVRRIARRALGDNHE